AAQLPANVVAETVAAIAGFEWGVSAGIDAAAEAIGDPPVMPFVKNLGPPAQPPSPGGPPGVSVSASVDPSPRIPLAGALLPLVFQANVRNTGAATDRFDVSVSGLPASFSSSQTVQTLVVPGGQSGQMSVCIVPSGPLPAPGTPITFTLHAVSERAASVIA